MTGLLLHNLKLIILLVLVGLIVGLSQRTGLAPSVPGREAIDSQV
jgi:hypothetical protein